MMRMLVLYPEPTDVEEFDRHYHERHVPLAKQLPGVLRYTASRDVAPLRGDVTPFYLIAEVDWTDRTAMQRDFASPLGKELAEDMRVLTRLCPGLQSTIFDVQEL